MSVGIVFYIVRFCWTCLQEENFRGDEVNVTLSRLHNKCTEQFMIDIIGGW